jgi:putative endonuclease
MPVAPCPGVPRANTQQTLGNLGESLAREELVSSGYAILATRYRTRFGEIDIVAIEGGTIVFVEVKARQSARYGTAAETIGPRKRRRIAAMALDYLARTNQLTTPCRFDVVAIDGIGTPQQRLEVYKHAFVVDGR